MALIRKRDTKPELRVRRLVHRLGYRYRLHRRDLPGTPDLVFPARRKVTWCMAASGIGTIAHSDGRRPVRGRTIGYRSSNEIDSVTLRRSSGSLRLDGGRS